MVRPRAAVVGAGIAGCVLASRLADRYDVTVPDPRVDFRLAAAMAVALDALQSR